MSTPERWQKNQPSTNAEWRVLKTPSPPSRAHRVLSSSPYFRFSYGDQRRCGRARCYARGDLPGVHVNTSPVRPHRFQPSGLTRNSCLQALRCYDHPVVRLLPDGRIGGQFEVLEVGRWVNMVSNYAEAVLLEP